MNITQLFNSNAFPGRYGNKPWITLKLSKAMLLQQPATLTPFVG